MIYKVSRGESRTQISKAQPTTLYGEGLYEVADLSRWLAATPELLVSQLDVSSPPVVLGTEVDIQAGCRVDVLAMDDDGTLVVCEVKRGEDDPLRQGLRYCGQLFSLPTDDLVAVVCRCSGRQEDDLARDLGLSEDEALRYLLEPGRRSIRLVLVAQDFPGDVFHSARWLVSTGSQISCIRFAAYRHDEEQLYLVPQQILPSAETAEIYAMQREAQQERKAKARTRNMFRSIIASRLLTVGEQVFDDGGAVLGTVRDDHIERSRDGEACVNFWALTGWSSSTSAYVRRDGELVAIGALGKRGASNEDDRSAEGTAEDAR